MPIRDSQTTNGILKCPLYIIIFGSAARQVRCATPTQLKSHLGGLSATPLCIFHHCFRCRCRCPAGPASASFPAHRLREARRGGQPDNGRLCGSAATASRLGMGITASGGRLGHRCVYLFDRQLPLSAYHPPHWSANGNAIRRWT